MKALGLNPYAIEVMNEIGIDISGQKSKHINEFKNTPFDIVVTVCDHAHESCPLFLGDAKVIHAGFDDPPKLATQYDTENEKLNCYRRVRDDIRSFVEGLPESLETILQFFALGPIAANKQRTTRLAVRE